MDEARQTTEQGPHTAVDVLVIGDLVADLVMPLPRLPVRADEHQMGHGLWLELGGACNFLVAAARLGMRTKAVGPVGEDIYGGRVIEMLSQVGVDVSDVIPVPGARTTVALVLVDDAGNHVFLGVKGTPLSVPPVAEWEAHIRRARAVYMNGYVGVEDAEPANLVDAFAIAHRAAVPTFFDPGPLVDQVDEAWLDGILRHTFCLQATVEEAAAMVGSGDATTLARKLLARGPGMVVLKQGAAGCLIVTPEEQVQVPAFQVSVRDTTGAGDAFDAGYVYGFLAGYTLQQVGLIANALGAATTTVVGAGTHIPQREVIQEMLRQAGVHLKEVMPMRVTEV